MRLSSRLAIRITGALIAVTFLATATLLAALYFFAVRMPMNEVRDKVAGEARQLEAIYVQQGEAALISALAARRQAPSPDKAFDALIDRDGTLLAGNLPSWPVVRRDSWTSIEADLYRDGDEDDHEALSRDRMLPDGRRLIVGRDVEVLADRQELMGEAFLWGAIPVLLFGIAGGVIISGITARRLNAVSRTARAVMDGDLSQRVPVTGRGDDFDQLGLGLNAMLDRNQELVASLGRVSDSIAHELRTPLARLRSALDRMDRGDAEAIEAATGEAERLQQIFDALLRIARLDTGRHQIRRNPVQLDELISDAVEFYAPEAEAREQNIAANLVPSLVIGDRDLLFQAVTNLLDNAIKFAPRGGTVRARLEIEGPSALLTISDSGRGVAEEHRMRLSERFYRAPGSENVGGTGLGLTLTQAIATVHQGTLAFTGGPGDFSAELRVPLMHPL
jgi:signal transduction histidine kinase